MDNKSFVSEGFLFTRCIRRGGKLVCKPSGWYRIPLDRLKKRDTENPDDTTTLH